MTTRKWPRSHAWVLDVASGVSGVPKGGGRYQEDHDYDDSLEDSYYVSDHDGYDDW
jgi:hypothetical protein